jgi:AcrR family transcriptional regulator
VFGGKWTLRNQEERSQRSRAQVLDAALALFSHQGYRATSVRDIAAKARVSTGNVYHHFKDKETIFLELLDHYWRAIADPEFPTNRALRTGRLPENLEEIGHAARESVVRDRPYVALAMACCDPGNMLHGTGDRIPALQAGLYVQPWLEASTTWP